MPTPTNVFPVDPSIIAELTESNEFIAQDPCELLIQYEDELLNGDTELSLDDWLHSKQ